MQNRLVYAIDEAAEQLSISRSQLYALQRQGQIHFHKIGRRSVVSHDELRRFLNNAIEK